MRTLDKVKFKAVAMRLAALLSDSDLADFNLAQFDLLPLQEHFRRPGVGFSLNGRRVVDVNSDLLSVQSLVAANARHKIIACDRFTSLFAHQGLQPGQGLTVVEIGLKHLCLHFGFLCRCDLGTVFVVTRPLYLNC